MSVSLKQIRYVHHKSTFYKQHHTHDLCELAYYVSGKGTLSQGDQITPYEKGTVHLVCPGVPHDENNEEESKIILLYFEMPKGFLEGGIYSDKNASILSLIGKLGGEMRQELPHKQDMMDCLLMQILIKLKRKSIPIPAENKDFAQVVSYIDENFQLDLDMHKIAKKACFSYERFRHVFKEQTGVSPHKYLNDKRVELATFLMEIYPGVSVSSIAKECGFSGVSQFSNAFKAKMGCSPMDYKQKLKNNPSNGT